MSFLRERASRFKPPSGAPQTPPRASVAHAPNAPFQAAEQLLMETIARAQPRATETSLALPAATTMTSMHMGMTHMHVARPMMPGQGNVLLSGDHSVQINGKPTARCGD